jgi:hypothetical protein
LPPRLEYLERCVQGEYLAGSQFGIADVTVASMLINYHYAGERLTASYRGELSAEELRGMLLVRRANLERAMAEDALRLRMVESRIAALEADDDALPDDVVIRPEPERRYLSLRTHQPSFARAVDLVLRLLREIPPQLPRATLSTLIVVSHSPEFEPDDLDLELGFELTADPTRLPALSDGRTLSLGTLPGHSRVAACVRVGSPDRVAVPALWGRQGPRWLIRGCDLRAGRAQPSSRAITSGSARTPCWRQPSCACRPSSSPRSHDPVQLRPARRPGARSWSSRRGRARSW